MTTKPTDLGMSTEDFAMLEVAYLLVLVLVKLKSEEERAEHVWGYAEGGMTRGLAVVRDVCTLLFALCFYFRTSLV